MRGSGTQANPYIIESYTDFAYWQQTAYKSAYYEMEKDIDFNGNTHISPANQSSANNLGIKFDGKGFAIKNCVVVDGGTLGAFGFFGSTNVDAVIQNVEFDNLIYNYTFKTGAPNVGILFGIFRGQMNNVKVKGTFNVMGITARIGLIAGQPMFNTSLAKMTNVYMDVDLNTVGNAPYDDTVNFIGGAFGVVSNTVNAKPELFNNVVINSRMNIPNPQDYKINGYSVGTNAFDTLYPNLYINVSDIPQNVFNEYATYVTDETILQPLTLDTEYWRQSPNSPPQLISFYTPTSGVQVTENVDVPYLPSSVTYKVSKQVRKANTIQFDKALLDVNRHYNTVRQIDTSTYLVTVNTTNAQTKTYNIDVPFGTVDVESFIKKSILSTVAIEYSPHRVTVDVFYPTDDTTPIYACTYVIENTSCIYTQENTSNCEVI